MSIGTLAEDIFAINGNPARIMHLENIFNSPDNRYGKGATWDGYTVHDVAGLFLRYLKSLPEPVVPYANYERLVTLMEPTIAKMSEDREYDGTDMIPQLQEFVFKLPRLNRGLLIYLLDLLAVFAAKSDINRMTARRLVGAFQPSIVSGPPATMDADAHHVAAGIAEFLIHNQEHFLVVVLDTETEQRQEDAGARNDINGPDI